MNSKLLGALGVALALGACVSTPDTNLALESARAAVRTAQADPNATSYDALDLANAAALNHREEAIAQPAYLATQTARLAQARGAAKADDARVAAGQTERDRIRLNARTREVESANRATAAANDATAAAIGERDQASADTARLQAELDQLKATPTPRGLVLTLGDVLFDTGLAGLKPGISGKMDQLAQFLKDQPTRHLEIDGYTDNVGGAAFNEDLSRRRADAVKNAMVDRGVDPARISTRGYGEANPVADNLDSSGRQLNRRVEVVIGDANGNPIAMRE